MLRRKFEGLQRQARQGRSFLTGGNHRHADGKTASHANGRIHIGADHNRGLYPESAGSVQQLCPQFFRRTEELFGSPRYRRCSRKNPPPPKKKPVAFRS